MEAQARIPAALCALHNFMRIHDSEVDPNPDDPLPDDSAGSGIDYVPEEANNEGSVEAHTVHDRIAAAMWQDYIQTIHLWSGQDDE